MEDVVPGVLQRLRESDIVAMAGLAGASLGQDYCRNGAVSVARRQGERLTGVVTLLEPGASGELDEPGANGHEGVGGTRYEVEMEVLSSLHCEVSCSCKREQRQICAHAAALLYQWVTKPLSFMSAPLAPVPAEPAPGEVPDGLPGFDLPRLKMPAPGRIVAPVSRSQMAQTLEETLAQAGLSELRALGREYGFIQAGLGKQQLQELLMDLLGKPETIRKVVSGLEKPQRQLLAAFALAGGMLGDEDLRGLFERFSLGTSEDLQNMLIALQAKILIVRTSLSHSLQPRLHTGLDIWWYIPQEVREALHVALPVTPFQVDELYGKGSRAALPVVELAAPYELLGDLLLVARALDGQASEAGERRGTRSGSLLAGRSQVDGSLALPPPDDQPASGLLEAVGSALERPEAYTRFVVRLLRQGDLLSASKEPGNWQPLLRAVPEAAEALVGPARASLLPHLFARWLNHPSYTELYELSEHGLRVRCRATPLNQPDLRKGELEQENSEARLELLALLAQVPVGEWINFSAFARFAYRLRPNFLQRRQKLFPTPHWWVEQEEGRPLHPDQLSDWLRVEGRYLAYLLQGPLHWWGLSDLAFSPTEQLLGFRLTPLASSLLQGQPPGESEEPEGAASLSVTSEGELLIPAQAASWPLLACVERFAANRGARDGLLRYALTAHSLSAAIGQGRDPAELLNALASAGNPASELELRRLLAGLEQRLSSYGRVRLYTGVSLLQTADVAVMQQLSALTSVDELALFPLQESLWLLKQQGMEQLLDELKRRGLAPLLHEEGYNA